MKKSSGLDTSLAPGFLIASPRLDGGPFERAVIVMVHHDEEGAMGFIVNKPLGIDFGSLLESADDQLGGEIDARCLYKSPIPPETKRKRRALLLIGTPSSSQQ